MPKLGVIIASVREGRLGSPVADWFIGRVAEHGKFDVDLLDLKSFNLPLLSERHHPRLQKYEQETTKVWSRAVSACDAFAIVTPEYNYGCPPALINALDHLYVEWHYKAAAFVSYGGLSGGTRSVQMAKLVVTTLRMMPLPEAVNIPHVTRLVKDGTLHAEERHDKSAAGMLDELLRWTTALAALRA